MIELADAPRRLDAEDRIEPGLGRYHRRYALHGAPGTILVQQVCAEIRYVGADEPLVALRCTYGEYFRFGDEGSLYDRHDFDVRHHGWSRAAVGRLLRQHAPRGARVDPAGPFALTVRKTFVLGRGDVDGVVPLRRVGGGEFGLLEEGPDQPAHAELVLSAADGRDPITVRNVSPFGAERRGTGRGWFTDERRFRLDEALEHRFEARRGRFDDGGGYRLQRA